jgi:hypothetical protein
MGTPHPNLARGSKEYVMKPKDMKKREKAWKKEQKRLAQLEKNRNKKGDDLGNQTGLAC